MDVIKTQQISARPIEKVIVHPLVLLSIVDNYNRVAKDSRKRVLGVLLGSSFKGTVDVTNSYAGSSLDPFILFLLWISLENFLGFRLGTSGDLYLPKIFSSEDYSLIMMRKWILPILCFLSEVHFLGLCYILVPKRTGANFIGKHVLVVAN